jgi:hypothetical protein
MSYWIESSLDIARSQGSFDHFSEIISNDSNNKSNALVDLDELKIIFNIFETINVFLLLILVFEIVYRR